MTSSTGITDFIPERDISAAKIATVAAKPLRLTHGTSTSPATGSQANPNKFFIASATAFPICSASPPAKSTSAPAAIPAAEPHSA